MGLTIAYLAGMVTVIVFWIGIIVIDDRAQQKYRSEQPRDGND